MGQGNDDVVRVDADAATHRSDETAGEHVHPGRRTVLRGVATVAVAGALGAAGGAVAEASRKDHRSPVYRVSPRPETRTTACGARVVWRTGCAEPFVALTFDDGPDPRWTPTVLELLARHDARATFFQHGSAALEHPDVARAVVDGGHEVGSHGWDHTDLTRFEPAECLDVLGRTHDALVRATGTTPRWLRPPYGRMDAPVLYAAAELGYDVALWSHHLPTDGAEAKVDRDLATASPGMVILCHDGRGTPAPSLYVAVERLVRTLTERGMRFVTMSEIYDAAPAHA
ncbi:polysaccharide deacetylase family protein [Sanguibacter sp. HDW7]|uniref:polysaccharide deacetylase family protein n=1 Tax=Sanguibacter sp. HDW7 TaxID=2714931 RepID=UPI00140E3FDD|nr:polysaccharide deacetylase family protein [Sanguibacter sp. HDW7]QIK83267.1 polysaccharide deacetylase family protein [Sanguibacter sp. HDW7]